MKRPSKPNAQASPNSQNAATCVILQEGKTLKLQGSTQIFMDKCNSSATSKLKTLLVIPAYNEEDCILSVAKKIESAGYDYVIVNDGSTDSTLRICKENNLNVLDLPRNLGIGGAVQAGHKYALRNGYDVDIQVDGDGQHDISYIPLLIKEIEAGADLAIGSRFLIQTEGFQSTTMRRIGIKWLSFMLKLLYKKSITDPTSGFRASGRRALELFSRTYPIDYPEPESIAESLNHGLTVREVSVEMKERAGGTSSIKVFSSVYYMIKVSLAIAMCRIEKRSGK